MISYRHRFPLDPSKNAVPYNEEKPKMRFQSTLKQRDKILSVTGEPAQKIKKQVSFLEPEKTYTQERKEAIINALISCGADVTQKDSVEKFIRLYRHYNFRVDSDKVRTDPITGKAVPFSNKMYAEGHYFGYDFSKGDMAKVESEMRHDLEYGRKNRPSNLPPLETAISLPERIYQEAIILPPSLRQIKPLPIGPHYPQPEFE